MSANTDATRLHLDDLPITVRTTGAGQPLLLLHGGAGPASVAHVADRLARRRQVIAPTHPGWDDTPRPDRLAGVIDLAEIYLELLEHLDLRGVAVLGSSFGGWVAAEMGIRDNTGLLGALVLMDAIGPPPLTPSVPRTPVPAAGPGGGPSPADLALLQSYTGPAMSDLNLLSRLTDVQLPALVIWGEQDPVVPVSYGRRYAEAFGRGEFTVIQGGGHLPTSEAPEPTFEAIEDFLDRSTEGRDR